VIRTYVSCEEIASLKGEPGRSTRLRFLGGGRVGDDELRVHGMPLVVVGETYYLFVRGNNRAFCPLVRVNHGLYNVLRDEAGVEHIYRDGGVILRSKEEVELPMVAASNLPAFIRMQKGMTATQFEREIRGEMTN